MHDGLRETHHHSQFYDLPSVLIGPLEVPRPHFENHCRRFLRCSLPLSQTTSRSKVMSPQKRAQAITYTQYISLNDKHLVYTHTHTALRFLEMHQAKLQPWHLLPDALHWKLLQLHTLNTTDCSWATSSHSINHWTLASNSFRVFFYVTQLKLQLSRRNRMYWR